MFRSQSPRMSWIASATVFAAFAAAAGCNGGSTEPSTIDCTPTSQCLQVDASASTAYVNFGPPPVQVMPANPATSTAWDLSMDPGLDVSLNGGSSGPGAVSGYCVCQNAAATGPEVLAMTPANQLAAFQAVTSADIPAAGSFASDALVLAISGWFTGVPQVAVPGTSFVIRYNAANNLYVKMHVTNIAAGQVTFDYATQAAAGGAWNATVTAPAIDVTGAPVYFDFATGAISTSASWSIQFNGYEILVNGGVSGTGGVVALPVSQVTFDNIPGNLTGGPPNGPPIQAYSTDYYGGVFASHLWYRYNLTGNHDIASEFDVYLVKRGTSVYKVQFTGYYNAAAVGGHITFRSQQIQ